MSEHLSDGGSAASDIVLGIDTSTDVVVGLAEAGRAIRSHRVTDPRRHVEELLPSIQRVIRDAGRTPADVAAVVVGMGPGPFTGLRVGIATARLLGLSLGVPVHGVCGLDAIAAEWVAADRRPDGDFLVVTDARRREVYYARYGPDGRRRSGPSVGDPASLPDLPIAGPGAALCPDRRLGAGAPERLDGGVLAATGLGLSDAGVEPLYLRRPDATEPTKRKSVLARRLASR